MRSLSVVVVLVLLLFATMSRARAQEATVMAKPQDLLSALQDYETAVRDDRGLVWDTRRLDAVKAVGYTMGVADVLNGYGKFCPGSTTYGAEIRIIVNYFNAHPEQWQKSSPQLIEWALAEKFPCNTPVTH